MSDNDKDSNYCVVRLSKEFWSDDKGVYSKTKLVVLKKRCNGYNLLLEETNSTSAEDTFSRITNIDDCKPGIYQVEVTNIQRDYETGIVDDFDLILVPTIS